MSIIRNTLLALSIAAICAPASSFAGSSSSAAAAACSADRPGTCPPGAPVEEVVPEYYSVPTKTKHIYYEKPVTQPVVTRIIHHVPVPVYDGAPISETVHAGPWTGPSLTCCNPAPRPVAPVARPVAPQVTGVYCYAGSKARYNGHGQRIDRPRRCR